MRRIIFKCLKKLLGIALFCGYFDVLFVNLTVGLLMNGAEIKGDLLKILLCAFLLAAGLPGIIWYQYCKIEKLEKELEEVQS